MDTRLSTRSRQARQQKQDTSLLKKKTITHEVSQMSPPNLDYSSSSSQRLNQSNYIVQPEVRRYSYDPSVQGNLIVVPPSVSNFIISNIHNPSSIISCLGEYYWKALCIPEPCKMYY